MAVTPALPFAPALPREPPQDAKSPALGGARAPLPAAETQRFRDEGFLVVPAVCGGAELQNLRALLLGLFAQRAGRDEGNQFDMLSLDRPDSEAIQPQIVKPSLYAPQLLRTPHFRRVQAMARQLLGPEAQFSFDHSIIKPTGKAAATPWHQDEAHNPDPHFRYDQISFWMPLQDVSEDNGCMRYIPKSNLGPLLPHRPLNGDPRIHALECTPGSFDESTALARPVPAGWCILHASRTLHSALPNRSGADRLVYVLAFRGPPLPHPAPVHRAWLESQRTARGERSLRWRSRGGFLVLLLRRVRRLSDPRTLLLMLQKLAHWGRSRWRQWWR
jgi:ectoine hydroxylase-related dioxygenase (phytanoyl-CoA dioxygenase family)